MKLQLPLYFLRWSLAILLGLDGPFPFSTFHGDVCICAMSSSRRFIRQTAARTSALLIVCTFIPVGTAPPPIIWKEFCSTAG
uniref:Putative secreted protein n=1 Tax=Anopheles marajoara TaxID=58244 RepID=A0A2M4CBZ7_9DIPT